MFSFCQCASGFVWDRPDVLGMTCPSCHMKTCFMCKKKVSLIVYSRTSMARTLMARLPRLFRTRSSVPWKKSHSCIFRIIYGDFLFYIENGILYVLIRIASMRRF